MAKSITATLESHLEQSVTTLATLWKITRLDGQILYLTDHDQDLTFDGQTYKAQDGYEASQVQSSDNMRVDNLETTGLLQGTSTLLDDSSITKQDLKDGKFDGASVEIRIVNWQDTSPTSGALILKTGIIGEVKVEKRDQYETEIRGLNQKLTQQLGEVYGSQCRANLFDSRCTNPTAGDGPQRATFVESAYVGSVTSNRVFSVPSDSANLFQLDPVSTGENDGTEANGSGALVLVEDPTPDGSASRPFEISTPAELEAIPDSTSNNYVLTANIDMTGRPTWSPIVGFNGTFDGRGYTISNLDIDLSAAPTRAALFDSPGGSVVIRRLGIQAATVRSGSASFDAAPLAVVMSSGRVEDCWSAGGTVTTDGNRAGGLVANVATATIIDSWAANVISGVVGVQVGGLISQASNSTNNSEGTFFDSDAAGTTATGFNNGSTALVEKDAKTRKVYETDYDLLNSWRHYRVAVTEGTSITFNAAGKTLTRSVGSWVTENFAIGDFIWVQGGASNDDTVHEISNVTATVLTVGAGDTIVDEGPVAVTVRSYDDYPRIADPGRF